VKKALWRNVFLAFTAFTFVCLLLSGSSRLIAGPDDAVEPIRLSDSWFAASLTCPAAAHEQLIAENGTQKNRPLSAAAVRLMIDETVPSAPQTDANGNVLLQQSYMRTVYQAFALGDGFA